MNFDTQQLYLGTMKASTTDRWLSLSQVDRRRHMYVIGQTGSGKSTLLNNCILPSERIRDVVYLNPSDVDFPLGFNPLRGVPENLQATATANLIAAFRSIWRYSWGPDAL